MSDLIQKIYAEIQNLPEKSREIFILTYFEGLTARVIAERLNIAVSTVTTQRQRALKYLRDVLSDEQFLMLTLMFVSEYCVQNQPSLA
jgi:RNA polymerase sigma-70 factor (ECF subfamily)